MPTPAAQDGGRVGQRSGAGHQYPATALPAAATAARVRIELSRAAISTLAASQRSMVGCRRSPRVKQGKAAASATGPTTIAPTGPALSVGTVPTGGRNAVAEAVNSDQANVAADSTNRRRPTV